MVKLLRRIINLFKKCKMAKINNTAAYAISNTIDGSDIVIGSENGNGGDTKNFQMSDISTFVLGNAVTPTLDNVCQQGASTTTGITVAGTTTLNGALDANSTADISDTLTLSKATGTGLQVDANVNVDGRLNVAGNTELTGALQITGAVDANSTADIADTLTLSKPSGTGLNVTSDATIGGTLTLGSTSISTSGINTGTILSTGTVAASFLATDPSGAPLSASAAGILGQIVADANYIYVCTATDTWKRVAIATW
jgi:hypothetical protein